jgi:hypothetical protein
MTGGCAGARAAVGAERRPPPARRARRHPRRTRRRPRRPHPAEGSPGPQGRRFAQGRELIATPSLGMSQPRLTRRSHQTRDIPQTLLVAPDLAWRASRLMRRSSRASMTLLDADQLSELAPAGLSAGDRRARPSGAAVHAAPQLRQPADPEGRDFHEVARLPGHGSEVCARAYAHLFDEWDRAERVPAEEAIRRLQQGRQRRAS